MQQHFSLQVKEFWQAQLLDLASPTQIPMAKRSHLKQENVDYVIQELTLESTTTSALQSLVETSELDFKTLLLGAWALLLSRYNTFQNVIFGATYELDKVLPVKVQVASDESLVVWLKNLQREWLALEPYKNVSLKQIKQWSSWVESVPLFDSCLVFEDANWSASLDCSLILNVDGTRWRSLKLYYDDRKFDKNAIARLLGHLQTLLEGMAANPQQRLRDLPLLTATEKHQLLVEWNDSKVDYPKDKCVHQLFEEQAERTPEAIAVILPSLERGSEEWLTYEELNRRANLLATQLQQMGVGAETFVAICMERSLETIVAILGILKAGGVYVSLDPAYPQERLTWMLEDSSAPVLITQSHLIEKLPSHRARLLCLDANWGAEVRENRIATNCYVPSSNLAYINYTSGSTGRPKGVAIPHRGVMRLVLATNYATLDGKQTILQLAPISFDAATFEIWGALLHGGCCVLFPSNGIPDLKELKTVITNYQISTLWLTAALFNTIITELPETLKGVQEILTGGEALSIAHIRKALELLPETQLINGYGPTESTTFTCCYRIPRSLDTNLTSIPIGNAIANTEVYILDPQLQPVPIGIPGELYIGGDGLAREYLNRPELNQEKFIAHPFSQNPDARLYKTGDLVRYLPNGNIEFIGRKDALVKIHGYLIELGEIETLLAEDESVRDAVVVMHEDKPGNKKLIAYVTPKVEPISVSLLKQNLKQRLPNYMIPTAIVVLDKIPLTPNGKADRRSFPIPVTNRNESDANFVAPSTPTEKALADIWCGVLGLETVGIEDNFFDLGGTSLLGMQLVARVQKQFTADFRSVKLYQYPTIRTLAQHLSQTEQQQSYQTMQLRAQRQKAAQIQRQRPLKR
jgi:amino acid adenylation domain-containing protein